MSTPSTNTGPLGQPRGIGFGILLFIITFGLYSLYWVFKTQDEVKNHSNQGVGGVLGLVIYIVVSIVTWFLVPSEVGKMYQQDGREAPFTGWTGLWLLLPIIGAFVWFIKVQGALNRYWESKAGQAAPIETAPPAPAPTA
jgi:amino acid transporter